MLSFSTPRFIATIKGRESAARLSVKPLNLLGSVAQNGFMSTMKMTWNCSTNHAAFVGRLPVCLISLQLLLPTRARHEGGSVLVGAP